MIPLRPFLAKYSDHADRVVSANVTENGSSLYGSVFWLTYAANTLTIIAVSILFRYADFVSSLGGTEFHLGLIVGVGTIGALTMRGVQGVGIDRYGIRKMWLLSLIVLCISLLAHLGVSRVNSVTIYCVRILMTMGLSGVFGASITYISLRAPAGRIGEAVGMLGSSGFVGMLLGPVISDYFIFNVAVITRVQVDRMFLCSSSVVVLAMACATLATRGYRHQVRSRRPSLLRTVRKYHPGPILLVGVAVGAAMGVPHVFLRAYTIELGIPHVKTFYIFYAITAFSLRILTRRFVDRMGTRPATLVGLTFMGVSMLAYLPVAVEWQLVIPAVFAGTAHAFIFPAIVGAGGSSFPPQFRGTGTTLMLSTFDLGCLLGQPAMGGILAYTPLLGLPSYPTLFVLVALGLVGVAATYAMLEKRGKRPLPGMVSKANTEEAPQAVVEQNRTIGV